MRIRQKRGALRSIWRLCRYRLIIPVFRSPHSAEFTARGVANGVFWGLTPSVGLQTLEITLTWAIARTVFKKDSSLLQGYVWVWVNNPVTMIPMYYAFYVTGLWLLGNAELATGYDAFVALWDDGGSRGWLERTAVVAGAIGLPMAIGCIPYATVGAGVSYRWAARVARARQHRILARRAAFQGL